MGFAADFFRENLVRIACVAHELWPFCVIYFLWYVSPMGYKHSRADLVLIACVAHGLLTFCVI